MQNRPPPGCIPSRLVTVTSASRTHTAMATAVAALVVRPQSCQPFRSGRDWLNRSDAPRLLPPPTTV